VRELSVLLLNAEITTGHDISFALFFYGFTFVVPLFYLVYSLIKKDRKMLWIGAIAFVFYLYHVVLLSILPAEMVFTIGGILLFTTTYSAIKGLKNKETGVTSKPDRFTKNKCF
jgi:hypothetical protein